MKVNGSKFIILVLWMNGILSASSDVGLLHETKEYLKDCYVMWVRQFMLLT